MQMKWAHFEVKSEDGKYAGFAGPVAVYLASDVDARTAELELDVQRLRQFIEHAHKETKEPATWVNFRAALDGEWLWQQAPGWNKNEPAKRP